MDISARIQQLEDMVREAKSMPLSSSVLVNKEEMLELIADMREALPEEIKQARWVVRDREELLLKARHEAEAIVAKARSDQGKMASREAVAQAAQEEAGRVGAEASEQARLTRLEAEDYVDAKLAQFEIALGRTHDELQNSIAQVQRGRERLRGGTPAEEEFGGAREDPQAVFDVQEADVQP